MNYFACITLFLVLVFSQNGNPAATAKTASKPPKTNLPVKSRSATSDAATLYDAIQSNDTDDILDILTHRTLAERLDISDYYSILYDQDLVQDLKDALSGDLENLIVALLTPTTKYYASEFYNAVFGLGTDEKSLTEILITLDNDQIEETSRIYYNNYEETLEDAIRGDADGFFRDFLLALAEADRDESGLINESDAIDDAEALYASGDSSFETFSDIFSHRNYNQLKLIFEEYEIWAEESIRTTIQNNFSGDIADAFLDVVDKVQDESAYFARRFYESMEGLGTSDSVLIRLAVTRSDIDIGDIKTIYRNKYSVSLASAIEDETSGDYRKGLLLLIGE